MHYNHHYFPFLGYPLLGSDAFIESGELTECWHTCTGMQCYSAVIQPPYKTKKNPKKPMEGAEQDGDNKRQELSELHIPHLLLRPYLNTSTSPSQKHQDISLQTVSLPTEARAETNR